MDGLLHYYRITFISYAERAIKRMLKQIITCADVNCGAYFSNPRAQIQKPREVQAGASK